MNFYKFFQNGTVRISPHLKQVAKDNVDKSTQLMGKEVLILQYEKIETVEKVSEDGIIYSSSTDKTACCIEVNDVYRNKKELTDNDMCPCGSGRRYGRCCKDKESKG